MSKEGVLLLFADLDLTTTPLDIDSIIRFIHLVKKIGTQARCKVKFVPISGRSSDYIRCFMHMMRAMFEKEGLYDVFEFGAGEQGATIIDATKSYELIYLGEQGHDQLKLQVAQVIAQSKFSHMLMDEPGKIYTCSLHIKNDYKVGLSKSESLDIFSQVKDAIIMKLGNSVKCAMAHKCLEVMHAEIGKPKALQYILDQYSREHLVVGVTFSGDAENDRECCEYISRLAEIKGRYLCNVFLPGNAVGTLESASVEHWKEAIPSASHVIHKAEKCLFQGVMDLIEQSLYEGTLVDEHQGAMRTRDDISVPI